MSIVKYRRFKPVYDVLGTLPTRSVDTPRRKV
jgi:hypothetical protein